LLFVVRFIYLASALMLCYGASYCIWERSAKRYERLQSFANSSIFYFLLAAHHHHHTQNRQHQDLTHIIIYCLFYFFI
jgi:hypothetical protein